MPAILAAQEAEIRFKASPGKLFARPYLEKKTFTKKKRLVDGSRYRP
jgi:hypothetical protein